MPTYVVAGASRGLGLQMVEDLLSRGDTVIALARNPPGAPGLQKISNDKLFVIKADIADIASVKASAEETAKFVDSVDVLINNAVHPPYKYNTLIDFPTEEELVSDFQKSFNTNTLGPILTTNAFLPLLRKGSQKKIVSINTGMADEEFIKSSGYSKLTSYAVSKAALHIANVKYAVTLKSEGFSILDLSPGVVNTATSLPTEAELQEIMQMGAVIKQLYPNWAGPITPAESVACILKIIDDLKPEGSGSFISHKGNREWV